MVTDCRGLSLTGADVGHARAFDGVVQGFFDYRLSTFPDLKALCEESPGFAMANLMKGFLLLSMGTRGTIPAAEACAAQVEEQIEVLTPREQHHLHALKAWARGDTAGACRHWDDLLFAEPLDLLALKLQHFTLFWMGNSAHMRDACARVMPAWTEDTPGYAHVLGMYAFGLEETGNYERAEALGREASERHPDDLWAIHSVAHVYEMQGRLEDGIAWLNQPDDLWEDRNPFKAHLWWHTALFAYDKGEYARALELYDATIWPNESKFYLDVQNAVSMLARLEFAGVDVGARWEELATAAEDKVGDHVLMFTEPHYAMAFGRTGRFDLVDTQLASLREIAENADVSNFDTVEGVTAPLCESMRDFYRGDYEQSSSRMMPIRYAHQPVGGSHAQRDIFALYLIDAANRSGNGRLARSLLAERLAKYPNHHASWDRYATLCDQMGDASAAASARAELSRIAGHV